MKYKKTKRWRYKLDQDEEIDLTRLIYCNDLKHPYFSIFDGILSIEKGYAWDGATGPVFQTDTTKIPSLVHDVLLQSMDLGLLPKEALAASDGVYLDLAIGAGMWKPRAYLHYYSMRYLRPLIWDRLPKRNYDKVYEV